MPVQQYDSTAGAGRPTPQQPPTGIGLPGPYGGSVNGKTPYVVWYVLTVWYGKNAVYGMVRLRYGTMVRCRGCIIWLNSPGGMVCFSI